MPSQLGVIDRVVTDRKQLALTFDDGPSHWTDQILDALVEKKAQATFFVRGGAVDADTAQTITRAVRTGCEIGNHTHNHLSYAFCDDPTARREFAQTHALLEKLTGAAPMYARPPFGDAPERLDEIAAAYAYRATIMWSISPDDWEEPQPRADTIVELVLTQLHPGAIVLLHDGWDPERGELSRRETVAAVRRLLPELGARGYTAVTVPRLLEENGGDANRRPST
jgi:chitooligosaccharide deacetylase